MVALEEQRPHGHRDQMLGNRFITWKLGKQRQVMKQLSCVWHMNGNTGYQIVDEGRFSSEKNSI